MWRCTHEWCVSIHAPARGATVRRRLHFHRQSCFNPRPRTGGDSPTSTNAHSLARFQSTPPHGGRQRGESIARRDIEQFQSTPPHGGRHVRCDCSSYLRYVSIHAPARGATSWLRVLSITLHVSIHAPARGATRRYNLQRLAEVVSIHAPARGATRPNVLPTASSGVSIHAPARGATIVSIGFLGR